MSMIVQPVPRTHEASTSVPRWRTVVWDDPVNLMSYVTAVFREYFGYSTSRAEELMMAVHTRGRATVSTGVRERVEAVGGALILTSPAPDGTDARPGTILEVTL